MVASIRGVARHCSAFSPWSEGRASGWEPRGSLRPRPPVARMMHVREPVSVMFVAVPARTASTADSAIRSAMTAAGLRASLILRNTRVAEPERIRAGRTLSLSKGGRRLARAFHFTAYRP